MRSVAALPKAHLHLHLTGAMRHSTMLELAREHGVSLPPALSQDAPPELSTVDERGWFRFQRLYDVARSVLRRPADVYRLLREIAEDEAADGSGWLEIQADPSGFAARFGGITAFTELLLDATAQAQAATGVGIAVIIAANRTRHPMDARALARLAAQFAGRGVVGFGLSNDERRGPAEEFSRAFRIAERAGLILVPHGGELCGPSSVSACLDDLHASRVGHGVHAAQDPGLVERLATAGIACEICPASNVSLGVYATVKEVPLRTLFDAGVPVALGADDPLLFGSRLAAQYELARTEHCFSDAELADLARMSIQASTAPPPVRARLLADVDQWLASLLLSETALAIPQPPPPPPRRCALGATRNAPNSIGADAPSAPTRPARCALGANQSGADVPLAPVEGAGVPLAPTATWGGADVPLVPSGWLVAVGLGRERGTNRAG